jgi:hypothetical protein
VTQNIVSLNLTDAQLRGVDDALTALETHLSGLIALSPPQKRSLRKMGEKSEAFCRQALRLLEQNPQLVPPNVLAAGALGDLAALDKLRPRMMRLNRLSERASDTDIALGSDVMTTALQVYGQIKLTGGVEGLETVRRDLGARFTRGPREALPEAA